MKKLIMLFLLVGFMCFGEEKGETQKSYEIIQREEIDFLKTQLIKSNNKIDDLIKKVEALEEKEENNLGLTYNVDQIYQNSVQYYDSALAETKWLIKIAGSIISALLIIFTALMGIFKINSDRKLKEERKEIKDDAKDLKKEIIEDVKELNKEIKEIVKEKIEKQEEEVKRKTLELDKKIEQVNEEMDKKIKTVEFNTELAIAINNSNSEEKIEELKKLDEKYPKKIEIYFELGKCLANEKNSYEEAISYFNKINELEPKKNVGHLSIGLTYERWGDDKKKEDNYIDAKKYFEEAIKNYKKGIRLDSNNKNSKIAKEKLKRTQKKLKELEEKNEKS